MSWNDSVAENSNVTILLEILHCRQIDVNALKNSINGISGCRMIANSDFRAAIEEDGFEKKDFSILELELENRAYATDEICAERWEHGVPA